MPPLAVPLLYAILDPAQMTSRDAAKVLHDLFGGRCEIPATSGQSAPAKRFS